MCGIKFSIYGVQISRKCIESMHFYSRSSSPTQNSGQNFLKICFAQEESGGENYDLLYQNSMRKYEDDLEL